jgi:hypothetical protein
VNPSVCKNLKRLSSDFSSSSSGEEGGGVVPEIYGGYGGVLDGDGGCITSDLESESESISSTANLFVIKSIPVRDN